MNYKRLRDLVTAVCFILLAALIAVKFETSTEQRIGGVFRVVDGDSLENGGRRLRLRGVDAPELGQTCRRAEGDWACGRDARQALVLLMQGQGVICAGNDLDKYGRLLVTCRDGDRDLNGAMVRQGMAVAFGRYEQEEQSARSDRLGLWAGPFDRPSDWRRRHAGLVEPEAAHNSSFFRRWFGVE